MSKIKRILLIFVSAITLYCFGQESINGRFLTSELFLTSPYYFTEYKNQLNCGAGLLISGNIKRFKLSTGIYYHTNKYYELFGNLGNTDKVTYKIYYHNVPLLFGFNMLPTMNKNILFISTGIIFNIPSNYSSTIYFNDGTPSIENEKPVNYNSGSSLRLGLQFERKLNSIFCIYTCVFADYKIQLDQLAFNNSSPQWHPPFPVNRFLMGLNVGLEWRYKKE
jgi:hypothetical protein